MPTVAILTHPNDRFAEVPYFLREMAEVWKQDGIRVEVLAGTKHRTPADLAILHVDLTVVPADYLALARSFPKCLNLYTTDTSKRVVSRNLLTARSKWQGPVIVKSNLNCAGLRESQIGLAPKPPPGAEGLQYKVFPNLGMVPPGVWTDPTWVVEKFLSESRDGYHCLRTYVFLGEKSTNSLSFAESPIIKSRDVLRREPIEDVPADLLALREELGFDFGKFDYGIVDGEVVLYDANRTPSIGSFSREQFMPRIRLLASGIESFL